MTRLDRVEHYWETDHHTLTALTLEVHHHSAVRAALRSIYFRRIMAQRSYSNRHLHIPGWMH